VPGTTRRRLAASAPVTFRNRVLAGGAFPAATFSAVAIRALMAVSSRFAALERPGRCPLDQAGALIGSGDLHAQLDQVAAHALTALRAEGARPQDVVQSVIYVVSDDLRGQRRPRDPGRCLAPCDRLGSRAPFTSASTLLGVAQPGFPGQLVDVDLTAALPD
jgi:enamine deaminase RidA (YjgF/YER057c/UK114 family)